MELDRGCSSSIIKRMDKKRTAGLGERTKCPPVVETNQFSPESALKMWIPSSFIHHTCVSIGRVRSFRSSREMRPLCAVMWWMNEALPSLSLLSAGQASGSEQQRGRKGSPFKIKSWEKPLRCFVKASRIEYLRFVVCFYINSIQAGWKNKPIGKSMK